MKNCGGGVGLLYNKCYKIEKQDVTSFLSFEYMEVLLRTPATVLRIGVLYRPPPSTENGLTATMFFNEFPILLERLAVASGHLRGEISISMLMIAPIVWPPGFWIYLTLII